MILLSFDLETTGLETDIHHAIEVGAVLYSTGQRRIMEAASYLVKTTIPITKEITGITGLTQGAVNKFGFESVEGLSNLIGMVDMADAVIGQNVIRYDKEILNNWTRRDSGKVPEKLWIDTLTDLPGVVSKHLGYMCADAGFLNLFPHSAMTDCLSVLKLVDYYSQNNKLNLTPDQYVDEMVKLAQSPVLILIGHQDRSDNSLAKKAKFMWNPDYKIWWKGIKECQLEEEVAALPFNVSKAGPEIDIRKLWYS